MFSLLSPQFANPFSGEGIFSRDKKEDVSCNLQNNTTPEALISSYGEECLELMAQENWKRVINKSRKMLDLFALAKSSSLELNKGLEVSENLELAVYKNLAESYLHFKKYNRDEVKFYANECIRLGKEVDDKEAEVKGYYFLSLDCKYNNELPSAIYFIGQSLQVLESLNNFLLRVKVNCEYAKLKSLENYQLKENRSKSFDEINLYFEYTIHDFRAFGNKDNEDFAKIQFANHFYLFEENRSCGELLNRVDLANLSKKNQIHFHHVLALYYFREGNYAKASFFAKKTLLKVQNSEKMEEYLIEKDLVALLGKMDQGVLYSDDSVELIVDPVPLAKRAVKVISKGDALSGLSEKQFESIWAARYAAELNLDKKGYKDRLCFSKIHADKPLQMQVIPYKPLMNVINYSPIRKISAIWSQTRTLFNSIFSIKMGSLIRSEVNQEVKKWKGLDIFSGNQGLEKTGSSCLLDFDLIKKQGIYSSSGVLPFCDKAKYSGSFSSGAVTTTSATAAPTNDFTHFSSHHDLSYLPSKINILYNYKPIQTSKEEALHFLLVPKKNSPAKNFLELDKEQYKEVLLLAQKVAKWAKSKFGPSYSVYFFDKTGENAGQTQFVFHAHLVVVKDAPNNCCSKLAKLFQLISPRRELSKEKLEGTVQKYKADLGAFVQNTR